MDELICIRCMTLKWLETARKKAAEWADTPSMNRIYRARIVRLENALVLEAHVCGGADPEPENDVDSGVIP